METQILTKKTNDKRKPNVVISLMYKWQQCTVSGILSNVKSQQMRGSLSVSFVSFSSKKR